MQANAVTFVDTNVLIYAHDKSEQEKQRIASDHLERLWEARSGVVSSQVLQEFYVVVTRRFQPPMARSEARGLVEAYGSWMSVEIDVVLILAASVLEQRHSISFWDALIIEAARRAGATRLLSEDMQAGRRFGDLELINPFV